MTKAPRRSVPAIKVHQWLPGWDKIDFDADEHRAKPSEDFFLISMPARELKSLSGIARRQADGGKPRTDDLGIQRQHDPERSDEISRFVEYGFPWSTLSEAKRKSVEFNALRKPGWLPTAVVLNIHTKGTSRNGRKIADKDIATISEKDGTCRLELPYEQWDEAWQPEDLHPFEVIDGQHRLWAFEGGKQFEGFELPVVAFVGLDVSWQAYLFWTINIKPKRINPSLAFDLYPLLRNEDWLDGNESHLVYRDTRSQELTEILWSYPASPWYDRVNMLGEKLIPWVTQSAWIKTLTATLVKPWDGRSGKAGGLFGGRAKREGEVLGWSRAQQAAFLIFAWDEFKKAVARSKSEWAIHLRSTRVKDNEYRKITDDLAFYGDFSLINSDQGVRGFIQVLNDILYYRAPVLKLNTWLPDARASANPIEGVDAALGSIREQPFAKFLVELVGALADFDWRTSGTPELDEATRRAKLVFRGSGGYKELRAQLLEHLEKRGGDLGDAAARVLRES